MRTVRSLALVILALAALTALLAGLAVAATGSAPLAKPADTQFVDPDPMGADLYQTLDELADDQAHNRIRIGVGENSHIRRAIIDKNARIGGNVRLVNESGIVEADGPGYYIRDGIIIVPKNGVVPDGTIV